MVVGRWEDVTPQCLGMMDACTLYVLHMDSICMYVDVDVDGVGRVEKSRGKRSQNPFQIEKDPWVRSHYLYRLHGEYTVHTYIHIGCT